MIRNLFLALFFFFGPALLLFMLRNIVLLLRIWLAVRSRRNQQPDVIDITPVERNRAPRWFYLAAVVLGVVSAVAGFMYLQRVDSERRQYVPAHMGEQGEIVRGHWQSIPPAP